MRGLHIFSALLLLVIFFPAASRSQWDCKMCLENVGSDSAGCTAAFPWESPCSPYCNIDAVCIQVPNEEENSMSLLCRDICFLPPPECCFFDPENPYPDYPGWSESRTAPESVSRLAPSAYGTSANLGENGLLDSRSGTRSCAGRRPWIFTQDLAACRTRHGRRLSCSPESSAAG